MNANVGDSGRLRVGTGVGRAWLPALAAGCGFGLSFGWLWFPALSGRVFGTFPGVFSGTLFSGGGTSVFAAALFIGLVAIGALARRVPGFDERTPAVLPHSGALACVVVGAFAAETLPRASALLFGLSAAAVGVFWTARVFALPPLRMGAALCAATALAWILSAIPLLESALLPVGIVLALGFSFSRKEADQADEIVTADTGAPVLVHSGISSAIMLLSSFFTFGIMSSAVPTQTGADLPASAVGIALAVASCARTGTTARKMCLIAVAAVVPAMLRLAFLPGLAGIGSLLGGIAEGAGLLGLALLAREWKGASETGFRLALSSCAASGLAAVFALVNMGGALGAAITRSGDVGYWLPAAVSMALVPAVLVLIMERRRRPDYNSAPAVSPILVSLPLEAPEEQTNKGPLPPATVWSELTRREFQVAELLIQGRTNPEIGAALFITENTVRTHIKNINHKAATASREQLLALLRRDG